jgi:hypothetical protein
VTPFRLQVFKLLLCFGVELFAKRADVWQVIMEKTVLS